MVCIFCGSQTKVVNSRHNVKLNQTWRRHKCLKCASLFTSVESFDLSKSILVESSDGKLNNFSINKFRYSIYQSLSHQKKALDNSTAITNTIVAQLLKSLKNPVIKRDDLVKTAAKILKRFDRAAYVHYLAHHSSDN